MMIIIIKIILNDVDNDNDNYKHLDNSKIKFTYCSCM